MTKEKEKKSIWCHLPPPPKGDEKSYRRRIVDYLSPRKIQSFHCPSPHARLFENQSILSSPWKPGRFIRPTTTTIAADGGIIHLDPLSSSDNPDTTDPHQIINPTVNCKRYILCIQWSAFCVGWFRRINDLRRC